MLIYQSNPTIVAKVNNQVLKIFSDTVSCEEEFNRLGKVTSPLVDKSHSNQYEMSVVKSLGIFNNILIMAPADGICLSSIPSVSDGTYVIVGEILAEFHLMKFDINGIYEPRLFGDFSIKHIYVNSKLKIISLIDPGANFMVQGNQLEDVVRFLFSVVDFFRYRPIRACFILKSFMNGYLSQKSIDSDDLKLMINYRKQRSIEKYHLQKTPLRARLGTIILNYNRAVIWLALRC